MASGSLKALVSRMFSVIAFDGVLCWRVMGIVKMRVGIPGETRVGMS